MKPIFKRETIKLGVARLREIVNDIRNPPSVQETIGNPRYRPRVHALLKKHHERHEL